MKNIIKHQHGFSMVEILVSFGLLSVLTLGLMKLFENSTKTSKDIQTKDEINQFNQELTMILSNPTNCEANLGGRRISINDPIDPFQMGGVQTFLNGESRTIHNVGTNRTEMDRRQRTTIALAEITNVDFNSSQGNNAIIDLEVTYEKPGVVFETPGDQSVNNNRIGSQTVRRIIKIGASLCPRTLHIGAAQNLCPQGFNLVEGPTQILINGQPSLDNNQPQVWGVCETCTDVNGAPVTPNSPIVSCNSIAAGGGGVNLDNLSATLCLRQGGTINPDGTCTQANNTPVLTPPDQCTQLGGTWNPRSTPPRCDGLATNNTPTVTPDVQCTQLGGTWNPRSTPPRCDGLSDLTQFQTQMDELRKNLDEQCQNFGGTLINGKCEMKLFGGKSMKDCVENGGTVMKVPDFSYKTDICRFDNSTCPQGWTQFRNWRTTSTKICHTHVIVDKESVTDSSKLHNVIENLYVDTTTNGVNGIGPRVTIVEGENWKDKLPKSVIYREKVYICDSTCGDPVPKESLLRSNSYFYRNDSLYADVIIWTSFKDNRTCEAVTTQIGCH